MAKNKRKNYYAVAKGHKTGVYSSWDDCKKQVEGYSRNEYRGFATKSQAEDYLQKHSDSNNTSKSTPDTFTQAYSYSSSTPQESSRKRRRVEEPATNDSKRSSSTSTNSSSKASSSSYEYDYSYFAGLDAADDDDPVADYYHSCGFYGYS